MMKVTPNPKLTRDERLRMSIEEVAFHNLKTLVNKKKISLVHELNEIVETTKNHEVRDSVAKILYCIRHKTSLKAYINAIKNPMSRNHRGYLVLCCAAYDCSPFLSFFIDLVLVENYYTTSNALLVIKEMNGPFNFSQYKNSINKLSMYLQENKHNERSEIVADLLNFMLQKHG